MDEPSPDEPSADPFDEDPASGLAGADVPASTAAGIIAGADGIVTAIASSGPKRLGWPQFEFGPITGPPPSLAYVPSVMINSDVPATEFTSNSSSPPAGAQKVVAGDELLNEIFGPPEATTLTYSFGGTGGDSVEAVDPESDLAPASCFGVAGTGAGSTRTRTL